VSWSVEWSQAALKDLKRLDATVAQRVGRAVDRLAETGEGDVKRLKGKGGVLRLRVGDWRVFFLLDTDAGSLLVLRVLHRGDAYR
jgi:mRNA interferase RelE/StbE